MLVIQFLVILQGILIVLLIYINSLFSLFFSTCILGELLTKKKMLSVLLSILGIIFIAVSDNDNNEKFEINIGDLWCLLSSFLYIILY